MVRAVHTQTAQVDSAPNFELWNKSLTIRMDSEQLNNDDQSGGS